MEKYLLAYKDLDLLYSVNDQYFIVKDLKNKRNIKLNKLEFQTLLWECEEVENSIFNTPYDEW